MSSGRVALDGLDPVDGPPCYVEEQCPSLLFSVCVGIVCEAVAASAESGRALF